MSHYKRFDSPKTTIRANGIYVPDEKRVYNMAGSYAEPVDGDMGGVYEYDFESGEVLAEYGVRPGYFRGYNFEPDVEQLARPVKPAKDYFVGELRRPQKLGSGDYPKEMSGRVKRIRKEKVACRLQEDILMVEATDHQLQKIYLFGERGNYVVDYSDTYQTMPIFSDMAYAHTAHLDKLPADTYQLYLVVENKLYKTGKYIKKTSV